MPRYYFHVSDGRTQTDSEGLDFPNLQAAKVEAQRFAGEVIKDIANRSSELRIEVADEADVTLFRMQFVTSTPHDDLLARHLGQALSEAEGIVRL